MKKLITVLLGLSLANVSFGYIFTGGPVFDFTKYPTEAAKLAEQIAKSKAASTKLTLMLGRLSASQSLMATEYGQYITIGKRANDLTNSNSNKLFNQLTSKVSGTLFSPDSSRLGTIDVIGTTASTRKTVGNGEVAARARTLRLYTNQATAIDAKREGNITSQEKATALVNGNYEEQAAILKEIEQGKEYSKEYRETSRQLAVTPHDDVIAAWNGVKQVSEINAAAKLQSQAELSALGYQRLQLLNSKNSIEEDKIGYNTTQTTAAEVASELQ